MTKKRANGEGTIHQRADGRWEGKISVGVDYSTGKLIRKTVYGKTQREVRKKMEKIKVQIQTGTYVATSNVSFGQWLDTWLTTYAKANVKQSTWESYETTIRVHIKPALGQIPIQEIRPEHLQRLYNDKMKNGRVRSKGGLSPKTVGYIHAVIHMALNQALKEQLVIRNVAEAVKRPKQSKYEINPLGIDEIKTFLSVAREHHFFLPFLLECSTGLRRGELLGLRWQDIDFANKTLTVKQSLVRTRQGLLFSDPKTPKSRRTIPLPDELIQALKAHKAKQNQDRLLVGAAYEPHNLVFCNATGHPVDPRNFTRHFEMLLAKAGLPRVRFHDLRHSHATMLLLMNEHPKVVQERLGHSTIAMTLDTYSHVLPGLQERATEKISQALNLGNPIADNA